MYRKRVPLSHNGVYKGTRLGLWEERIKLFGKFPPWAASHANVLWTLGRNTSRFLRTSAWEAATPKVLRICLLTLALNEKEFEYLYSDQRSIFQLLRNF